MEDPGNTIIRHLESIIGQLDRMDRKIDLFVNNGEVNKDDYLDNQDLCLMLGITKKTLYRYRKKGLLIPHSFEGRKLYYKKSEIADSLKVKMRK